MGQGQDSRIQQNTRVDVSRCSRECWRLPKMNSQISMHRLKKMRSRTLYVLRQLFHLQFLSHVSILTRDVNIAILSVCLFVCLFVTFRCSMETA